ncbi:DUF1905 domain-containing protein [Hephaestia mangrovi]|uniref:DUF1905 domain-containing protein n=1 Tax=Hephaestia mangrovi TaxID=2873268 RepID=UPI001CA78229|nr:DUF1905 domain-containing protein [Hephaestia mangrovi]MBY8826626.1 DUF1905 domain-containing protein [Hephaestia mangrovi]
MSGREPLLDIAFAAEVIHWRGPAPFYFVAIPADRIGEVRWAARIASYGWGCVPVEASVADVAFTTALFPKDGGYLLPLKAAVRKQAGADLGDTVAMTMRITAPG